MLALPLPCRAIGRVEISELREALDFPHPLRGEDVAAELGLARGGRGAELDEGGEEDDPCDHDCRDDRGERDLRNLGERSRRCWCRRWRGGSTTTGG